jgi:hypothetical protein
MRNEWHVCCAAMATNLFGAVRLAKDHVEITYLPTVVSACFQLER